MWSSVGTRLKLGKKVKMDPILKAWYHKLVFILQGIFMLQSTQDDASFHLIDLYWGSNP